MTEPKTLEPGDRVYVAPDAAWANGAVSDALQMLRGREATVITEADADGDVGLAPFGALCAAGFLTLIEESTPEPAPAVTDEQRAAWLRLSDAPGATDKPGATVKSDAALVAPLLPSELTNPQPVLPTKPGAYLSPTNVTIVLDEEGDWMHGDIPVATATVRAMLPLIPLVPERPQITREQVVEAVDAGFRAGMPGSVEFSDALHAALVNGADQ